MNLKPLDSNSTTPKKKGVPRFCTNKKQMMASLDYKCGRKLLAPMKGDLLNRFTRYRTRISKLMN